MEFLPVNSEDVAPLIPYPKSVWQIFAYVKIKDLTLNAA